MKKQRLENIFIILISLGALCFVLIGGLSIWADFEASLFNSARRTTERLSTFNCPSIIAENEVGIISASFTNTSEREIKPRIQTFVTDGYVILMQEQIDTLTIEPGETESVEVKVTADNAVYNRLILARMHQFNYGPLPYRNASCGIFVLGISFMTGSQFITLTVITGLILSLAGIVLWLVTYKPIVWDRLTTLHEMIVIVGLALLIMIAGLASWWLFGIFLIVIWLLLVVGIISQKVLSSNKRSNQDKRHNAE
jgi:hypothetical protein